MISPAAGIKMARRRPPGRRRKRLWLSVWRHTFKPAEHGLYLLLVLTFCIIVNVLCFEPGFSSFTFGAPPPGGAGGGGGPRFQFNGFPGMGGGGGGAVDNDGYYKILEVSKTADTGAITKSYRKLAKRKHPDKGGDPEEFKALAEAYEVLSDPEKRRMYDQVGKEGLQGGGGMDQRRAQADMFRTFFDRFSRPQPVRMRDVIYEMDVTLEELCKGGTKKVRIWSEGGGDGRSGKRGERVAKDIEIDLQSSMHTGSRVVFEGGVEPIEEGIEAGDIIFVLRETRHRTFRRLTEESPHLTADITITLAEALTGFVRPITLVDGRTVYYRLVEGEVIAPNAVRKLQGCGMPLGDGVVGDLYLRFVVEFPNAKVTSSWGEDERQALRELLPPKPKFPRETKNIPVQLQDAEAQVQSRFKAGLYDRPPRGLGGRSGAWGGGGGQNPFDFFGL